MPFADTEAMTHLAEIARAVAPGAPGAHAVLVLDDAGWHGAGDLVVPDNISLLTLPPYAPELNPIENVWHYLRGNKLAITVFDTYDAIVDKCCEAWSFFATDPATIASITSRRWAEVISRAVGINLFLLVELRESTGGDRPRVGAERARPARESAGRSGAARACARAEFLHVLPERQGGRSTRPPP